MPEKTEATSAVGTDWFLQALVEVVDNTDVSIGITLSVGGVLISGHLTSGSAFFNWAGGAITGALPSADPKHKNELLESFSKIAGTFGSGGGQEGFVHLKDARMFGSDGNAIPSAPGLWWRGKLAAIDGFTLGKLGSASSSKK